MVRRRNGDGLLADIFLLAATVPWWVGVAAAVGCYLILHRYASVELSGAAAGPQLVQTVIARVAAVVAYYLQYIVPALLLAGAIASYAGRKKRQSLLEGAAKNTARRVLEMTWRDFELLVGEAFRRKGYAVTEAGGGGPDGGVDLVVTKAGATLLVQCKQWRSWRVGEKIVRELNGVVAAAGATGGVLVTSGSFTPGAVAFAQRSHIELIDGVALSKMIEEVRGAPVIRTVPTVPTFPSPETARATDPSPVCPRCGAGMVKRVAKQGAHAGKEFWGCSRFPECRGVRGLTDVATT